MSVIEWFQDTPHFDLCQLMQESRFVSCQSYALADAVGILNKEFIKYRTLRKKRFAELRHYYRESGAKSVADAERQAEVNPEYTELYDREKTLDARLAHANNLMYSVRNIMDAMRQEIAELRAEKKMYVEEEMMERVIKKIEKRREGHFPTAEMA